VQEFEIGQKVDILIGDEDVLKFKCVSIHDEQRETRDEIINRKYFGFELTDYEIKFGENVPERLSMSLSWETRKEWE
jgi:hypothetical protein